MEPDVGASAAATQANTDTVDLELNKTKSKPGGGVI